MLDGKSFPEYEETNLDKLDWTWSAYLQQELEHFHFPVGNSYADVPGATGVVFQYQTEAPVCQQSSRNFDSWYQTGQEYSSFFFAPTINNRATQDF